MLYSFLSGYAGNERIKFISISFGIMVSFSMYGLLYEKVVKKEYGDGEVKEKFTDFQALAGLLCIIYFVIGYGKTLLNSNHIYIINHLLKINENGNKNKINIPVF